MTIQNKLVIFDWDDTLFPTTFYNKKRFNDISLTRLSYKMLHTLKLSIIYYGCNVYIITNAARVWVEYSVKKMIKYCNKNNITHKFNEVLKILDDDNIKIFSARDEFGSKTDDTVMWKYCMFRKILSTRSNVNTIISIGDSYDEYEASGHVKSTVRNIKYIVRIKLRNKPELDTFIDQYDIMARELSTNALKEKSRCYDIEYLA